MTRLDGSISYGRHGIYFVVVDTGVWRVHGDDRVLFSYEEYGGGQGAMAAAKRDAEERNQIQDALNLAEGMQS